jgi:uncharacterized Fe-S cluster-containing radical SAM superfamily protein
MIPRERKVLLANLKGSVQSTDMSLPPNCGGLGRIHYFEPSAPGSGWMDNPLPMLPASSYLDIPPDALRKAQIFQFSVCNFDCWYCYVDRELRCEDSKRAQFTTAFDLLEQMSMCDDEDKPRIIGLSGGQPDIVPEFSLWFLEERERMGLEEEYFLWIEDNLSTDMRCCLKKEEIARMAEAPGLARVGCLKGFDPESFSFNTGADREYFYRQIDLLENLVAEGFDQYGYIILTAPNLDFMEEKIMDLFDILQDEIHRDFPLRIFPLEIHRFNANRKRFSEQAASNQYVVLEAWKAELRERFPDRKLGKPDMETSIR